MKASRKLLIVFAVPLVLSAVAIWFLAERRTKVVPRPMQEKRVQIFARAPVSQTDLSRKVAALSSLLVRFDGGTPPTGEEAPAPARDGGADAATLRGLVIDALGNQPGECTLYLRPSQPGELALHSEFNAKASTGVDGIVTAQGIGPGMWDIFARCEKGLGKMRNVRVTAEGTSDFGTLKLDGGGTLRGTVVETGTKKPVATAAVTLYSPWPNRSMPDATTAFSTPADQDGRFEFEAVPEGKWNLRVLAPGYLVKDLQGLNTSGRGSIDLNRIFLVRGNIESIRDNSQFGGIGVSIGRRKDEVSVFSVFDNTPAQNAGLKRGDIITSVNGQPASELTTDEVIALIRGDERTAVMLKVKRGDRTFDINIVRDTIKPGE